MMGLCQKDLVWRNYLRFVQDSLRIVIGQYLEKRRMLFQKRDIVSRKCHEYDEVVLWNSFELFDQLHIMQLLEGFAQTRDYFQHLSVIFIDDYYLGRVSIESLPQWLEKRESVSKKQLVLGQLGWKAFTAQTPELMFEMALQDTSVLPFLQRGLLRLFEEFPAEGCVLTRTEHCF